MSGGPCAYVIIWVLWWQLGMGIGMVILSGWNLKHGVAFLRCIVRRCVLGVDYNDFGIASGLPVGMGTNISIGLRVAV